MAGKSEAEALLRVSELFQAKPEPDPTFERWSTPISLLYHAQNWFVMTGQPPNPEDWKGTKWPDPDEATRIFGDWGSFIRATGVLDSPMGELMSALASVMQDLKGERETGERQLAAARKALERQEQRLAARQAKVEQKLQTANAQRETAREDLKAARREIREHIRQIEGLERDLRGERQRNEELQASLNRQLTREQAAASAGVPTYRCHLPLSDGSYDAAIKLIHGWVGGGEYKRTLPAVRNGTRDISTGDPEKHLRVSRAQHNGHEMSVITFTEPHTMRPEFRIERQISTYRSGEHCGVLLETRIATERPTTETVQPPAPRLPALLARRLKLIDDQGWPRQAQPTTITRAEAEELCTFLLDEQRELPVIALSCDAERNYPLDPAKVAEVLAGAAHVVTLDRAASFHLTEQLGRELSAWNGAARIYMPGRIDADHASFNIVGPTLATDYDGRHLFARVARSSLSLPMPPAFIDAAEALVSDMMEPAPDPPATEPQPPADDASAERISGLERTVTSLEEALAEEQRRSAALAHALASRRPVTSAEPDADTERQLPQTVLDATETAAERLGHLRFAARAFSSAADSPFRRPADILMALERLDQLAADYEQGSIGTKLSERALSLGLDWRGGVSDTTASRYRDAYTFDYDGVELDIGPHVVIGNGAGAGRHARIYLHMHEGANGLPRGIYVAHIGRHLPDSTTA